MLNDELLRRRLGDALRRYRSHTGLSQAGLARRLGLTASSVGAYERGDRWPSDRQLATLIDGCSLNPRALFGPVTEDEQERLDEVAS